MFFWYSNIYMKSTQPCNDNKAENQHVYFDWYSSRVQKWATRMLWRTTVIHFRFFSFLQFETWTLNIIIIILKSIRIVPFDQKWMLSNFPSNSWKKKTIFFVVLYIYYCVLSYACMKKDENMILSFIHQISTQSTTRMGYTLVTRLTKKKPHHQGWSPTKTTHRLSCRCCWSCCLVSFKWVWSLSTMM